MDQVGAEYIRAKRPERRIRPARLRDERGEPVDVGKTQPLGPAGGGNLAFLSHVVIAVIVIRRAAEYTHRARMRDEEVLARGGGGAGDQRERLHHRRARADIIDPAGHVDHVFFVDREGEGVDEAAIAPMGQRDGAAGRQHIAIRLPYRVGGQTLAVGEEAEAGVMLRIGPGGGEQAHRIAVVLGALVVILEHDVVDRRAGQVDRAGNAGRIDPHPVAPGQRRVERDGRDRHIAFGGGDGGLFGRRVDPAFDDLTTFGLRVETAHQRVPPEQEDERQEDGEQDVTLVVQGTLSKFVAGIREPDRARARPTDGSALYA